MFFFPPEFLSLTQFLFCPQFSGWPPPHPWHLSPYIMLVTPNAHIHPGLLSGALYLHIQLGPQHVQNSLHSSAKPSPPPGFPVRMSVIIIYLVGHARHHLGSLLSLSGTSALFPTSFVHLLWSIALSNVLSVHHSRSDCLSSGLCHSDRLPSFELLSSICTLPEWSNYITAYLKPFSDSLFSEG